MKRILFLLAIITCSLALKAQQNLEDVIYLKSGKVVRGHIYEQNSEEVKILLVGKYKFTYLQSDIEKITKEPATSATVSPTRANNGTVNYSKVKEEKVLSPNGYIGILEAGYGLKMGDYGMDVFKFSFINGYRFNENVSLGLGIGFRALNDDIYYEEDRDVFPLLYDNVIFPVFVDLRVNFSKNKVSPYLVLNGGYTFATSFAEEFEGLGPMFSPGVGVKFGSARKSAFTIGLAYEAYQVNFLKLSAIESSKQFSNSISLNIGFSF